MFFVSEEFLRKYQRGDDIVQTVDEAVPIGEELFGESGGKKDFNVKRREKST